MFTTLKNHLFSANTTAYAQYNNKSTAGEQQHSSTFTAAKTKDMQA